MLEDFKELIRYRQLILMMVQRDLQMRYKNSVLGFFWSLIPLLMQVAVISIVMGRLYHGVPNGSIYILCAYIPWNFMSTAVLDGTSSVLAQYALLKKVYFPREILPIASVLSNLVHMALALLIFVFYRYVVMWAVHGWPGWPPREVFWLPVLILIAFLLVLGIVFFLSTWNVFFEDIKFIAQNLLQLAFFALPIFWFAEQFYFSPRIPSSLHHPIVILYNSFPVAWLITAFKQIMLPPALLGYSPSGDPWYTASFDYRYFALAFVLSLGLALAGYRYFNSRKWQFVERA